MQYLLPGVIVMNVLLAQYRRRVAEDLRDGIVDRFRSLPMSCWCSSAAPSPISPATRSPWLHRRRRRAHGVPARCWRASGDRRSRSCPALHLRRLLALHVSRHGGEGAAGGTAAEPPGRWLPVYLSGVWIPVETMSPRLQWFARNQPVNGLVEALRRERRRARAHHVWVSVTCAPASCSSPCRFACGATGATATEAVLRGRPWRTAPHRSTHEADVAMPYRPLRKPAATASGSCPPLPASIRRSARGGLAPTGVPDPRRDGRAQG